MGDQLSHQGHRCRDSMSFRSLNRAFHWDVGYLCVGFTLLYAFTGVMLNHIHDLNHMYAISGTTTRLEIPLPENDEAAA